MLVKNKRTNRASFKTGFIIVTSICLVQILAVGTLWVNRGGLLEAYGRPTPSLNLTQRSATVNDVPEEGTSEFMNFQDDKVTPVTWDSCREINYVVHGQAPEEINALLRQGLEELTEASGLKFNYQGETDESPNSGRALYQPERYGDQWAPVLISWSNPEETPDLAEGIVGRAGGYSFANWDDTRYYVSGAITLDLPQLEEIIKQGRPDIVKASIMHEAMHLLGLDHVRDKNELMSPYIGSTVELGPGDLYGLSVLGQGPCSLAL